MYRCALCHARQTSESPVALDNPSNVSLGVGGVHLKMRPMRGWKTMYNVKGLSSRNSSYYFLNSPTTACHSSCGLDHTNQQYRLLSWLKASCGQDLRAVRLCHMWYNSRTSRAA